ncbi:hypothetical protein GPALN_012468 [Globodera pallida]|nr:hypothetical protein GPALN_012468 [Globodera pallida]
MNNEAEQFEHEQQQQQLCGEYEMYTLARFLFLSLSSVLALFGAGANLALFVLFSSRVSLERANTPATLYPRVLALLDASICAGYILLFGADAAVIYLRIRPLFLLYHLYIVPAFVLSRICQLAIPYMLIFATLERLVWISSGKMRNSLLRRMYSVRGRQITVGFTLGTCALLRLPTYWATTVHEYPQCDDFFRTKTAGPADWVMSSRFFYVFDFHLLSIAQTVFPFFVLLAFNLVCVRRRPGRSRGIPTVKSTFCCRWSSGGCRNCPRGTFPPPSFASRRRRRLLEAVNTQTDAERPSSTG